MTPEISAKICQILLVWFGTSVLDSFLVITWDLVRIFQNRFLRRNREIEPVDLNTMNPIIGTIFFTYKGVSEIFNELEGPLRMLGIS